MASPDLELQGVIVNRLKGRPELTALVGQRVYDRPPTNAPFPYVEYGESDVKPADLNCVTSDAIYVTIHVWSQYSGGFKELKDIIYEIVKALDRAPLTLPSHRLISLSRWDSRTMKDPDDVTTHGVVEFIARIETPA